MVQTIFNLNIFWLLKENSIHCEANIEFSNLENEKANEIRWMILELSKVIHES